jgi:predicted outer membrane repeat protein
MFNKVNITTRLAVLVLMTLLCSYTAVTGKVIYVDADAPVGINDGSSWENAYLCLQDALAETEPNVDIEPNNEIRVANGIYKPDRRTTYGPDSRRSITSSGDWLETFVIDSVTMKGGYAGFGARNPDERDIDLCETILSGDLYGNDTDVDSPDDLWNEPSRVENSFHVVTCSGRVAIDGFTITGGNANESSNQQNNAKGGGLFQRGQAQISNCTFTKNSALFSGGGIYNSRGELSLTNCTFAMNLAGSTGGGGIYNNQSDISLSNCTFVDNATQFGYGGGIYSSDSDPNLNNCIFIENTADNGGGIYNRYSSPTFINCVFIKNTAGMGAGIANFNRSQNNPTLRNCLFTGNRSRSIGGGIYNYWGELILTNCTFAWNSADEGNALACRSDNERRIATLTNCILWDGGNEIWNNELSIMNVFYSNIQGGWFGEGNIDENPQFVDMLGMDYRTGTEDDDLRLSSTSPCVDAGDPNYVPEPDETDLDGNRRIINSRVDMGAYEFHGIIYVDDDAPYDTQQGEPQIDYPQEDGTKDRPFDTIQEAINIASNGYIILVKPGVYDKIDFRGKAITIASTDGAAIIEVPLENQPVGLIQDGVTFHTGEGPDSVLKNFIIRNFNTAISLNYGSSPKIYNVTIVDNDFGIAAYENSNPDIRNCILWNNTNGDLFQCEARYSCVENDSRGEGNIQSNPLFVNAANGDYHLKSQGWRWNMDSESWTWDDVTSRCIDTGDPTFPLGNEPMQIPRDPNNLFGENRRINMGAFGGTIQASIPPHERPITEEDTTPPVPNPAQWDWDGGAPREINIGGGEFDFWVQMTATEASDDSGLVEYFFECTTNSGFNSGWQSSNKYIVLIGRGEQGQRFRVKVRDLFGNETEWSDERTAH